MAISDNDRAFLARRSERRRVGLYVLPASLALHLVVWGVCFAFFPLWVNPFAAAVQFEGMPIEPGTVTKYALTTAVLMNVVFALSCALLVVGIAWARHERRYLKLLTPAGDASRISAPRDPA
jgi:hypothetical protein